MPAEMTGRRIPVKEGEKGYEHLEQAGDYCGPVMLPIQRPGAEGQMALTVWYLLPIARDADVHGPARSIHCVQSPPHRLIEEPDGSLTIRESIGAGAGGPYYWHGYLTNGKWELNKSKP